MLDVLLMLDGLELLETLLELDELSELLMELLEVELLLDVLIELLDVLIELLLLLEVLIELLLLELLDSSSNDVIDTCSLPGPGNERLPVLKFNNTGFERSPAVVVSTNFNCQI
jgi:hypothetical protein